LRVSRGVRVDDRRDDRDAVALGDGVAEAPPLGHRSPEGYWPIGCHTVLSSRKLLTSHGLWTSGRPRTTRLTLSAASSSSSVEAPSAPQRSIAFTSMWLASVGATSA